MYRRIGIVVVAGLLFWSCSDDLPNKPKAEMFSGILRTDAQGQILGGDTTDWLPRPVVDIGLGVVSSGVVPGYPNPFSGTMTLGFAVADSDSVWIQAYDRPGVPPVETIFTGEVQRGSYTIAWTPQLAPGIYRVRFRSTGGFSAYGDVEIQEQAAGYLDDKENK